MSESNNIEPKKKSSAKRTFIGLIIFTVICAAITYACIYLTLESKGNVNERVDINPEEIRVSKGKDSNYIPIKLTDKAYVNNITQVEKRESYGEIIDYYEYNDEITRKLDIRYVQIDGLKNKEVQDSINQKIRDKINDIKEELVPILNNNDIQRMWVTADIMGNFSDVISVYVDQYVFYDFDDEDYENDVSEDETFGLNFSLATGEEIKFEDMFWEGSPIKNILSQSLYKELAWDYAFDNEDYEWDWNMEHIDYSTIESKVYNFMAKYNQNPEINFYFSPSNIEISKGKGEYSESYSIDMADFYQYISIYTKYKASNLYEDNSISTEFYVFGNPYLADEIVETGSKADNIYYTIYSYDNPDEMIDEAKNALKAGKDALDNKINDYVQNFKADKSSGYIIEAFYLESEYQEFYYSEEQYGYNLEIEISKCPIKYYNEHLEDALAAGAREPRADVGPASYEYIDDNFEFYERYSEWMNDYTDESTKDSNTYTKEDRDRDIAEWENSDFEEIEEIEVEEEPLI